MKRIISILTLVIMLITSLPVSVYISAAEALTFEGERATAENLYYSDIFYNYPYYLKNNTYLNKYQADSSALISNVLAEYVTTEHFAVSVTSQVLGQATDTASVVKYIKSNMNYQDFVFENELDTANRLLLQAVSENDIKKGVSIYSKQASEQIKNFSSLTKLATTLEETTDSLEDAGYMADDIDMYEGLLTVTFDFLGEVAPRLSSKLPEISDTLETQLGEGLESVSTLADASEFAAALAVTVLAQEAQLELVYQILNDAPTDSMLYTGMTRLKGQLEGGAVTFFTETYLKDAVFKKVIDKFTDGIVNSIAGKVPGINLAAIVIAVVDVVNTVLFKWILGADYDTYISAVLLTDYKEGLAATLDNMSDRYATYFASDDIIAYDNVFNTYISVNKEVYNLYCKLSTHNTTYDSAYTASYSGIYEDMSYEKYIAEVKAYILAIPEEIRERADHGTWTLSGNVILDEPTDEVALGYCYLPNNFKGSITLSNGSITITEGDSFTIDGDLSVTGSSAKVTNNGELTVAGDLTMGDANTRFYNYGVFTVENMILNGYYRVSFDYHNAEYYNYGKTVINKNLITSGTSRTMMYMTVGNPELRVGGDIDVGYHSNFSVTVGTLYLCGNTQQSVKCLSVNNLTVTNPEGIKYLSSMYVKGRYDLCGNTLVSGGYATYLEGAASLAPNNDYQNIQLNCAFIFEGNIKADITAGNNVTLTVPEGMTVLLDGNLSLTGSSAAVTNNGELTVTGDLTMADANTRFYNYGVFTVENMTLKGYYRQSWDYKNAEYYNYGKTVINKNLTTSGTNRTMIYMTVDEPELYVIGDIDVGYHSNFSVTCGTLYLCGNTQQSVKCLSVNNLTVTNPEGIKYLSSTYVKGRYDLCGNTLVSGGYATYLEGNASLAPNNDYQNIQLNCAFIFEGNIKADITAGNNVTLTVPEGVKVLLDGYLSLSGSSAKVTNNGELTVTGDLTMADANTRFYNYGVFTIENMTLKGYYRQSWDYKNAEYYNYGKTVINKNLTTSGTSRTMIYMTVDEPELYVIGDIDVGYHSNFSVTCGTLYLCGNTQQSVKCLSVNNLTVTNPEGIKYLSDTVIYGRYDLCGNALDNNGYCTKLESSASLAPDNNYGNVHVTCDFTVEGNLSADLTVTGNSKKITVPEGKDIVLDGFIYLYAADTKLYNNGKLTVTDYITMGNKTTTYVYNNGVMNVASLTMNGYYGGYSYQYRSYFHNNGELNVAGDILMQGTHESFLYMNEDDVILRVGGNVTGYNVNSFPYTKGKVIFNGDGAQTVKNFAKANIIEIENESYEGVDFTTNVNYTTLFDHNGNKFTGTLSNVDYDGDGLYDRYDPKPTVNEKCSVMIRDYDVMIGHAEEINHIRYASGIHESSASIRNAEDCVNISGTLVAENTANNVYTRNMPDGGVYTFWIRLNDDTTFLRTVDMSTMRQGVTVDGVRITLHNLYGIKDYFIAEGDFDSYSDLKANGYVFSATAAKLSGKHSYTYTVSSPGRHTLLVRYTDPQRANEVFKVDLSVDEPVFTTNGLQVTISNIPDVKVIRTAYGEWNTVKELKATDTIRNFSNKTAIKDAEEYTIQYRQEGTVTIIVEYNNGYIKVFHYDVQQKKPSVSQEGNTVAFTELDGLVMIRYAEGEYTTSSQIKAAEGSKVLKSDSMVDGTISVTLDPGTYTFCVQYDDESYNYYTITIQ